MTTPNLGPSTTGRSVQAKGVLPRHLMTDKEKAAEWVRLYKMSPANYEMRTLISCLKSDGEGVLKLVLNQLGLEQSAALVKDASK